MFLTCILLLLLGRVVMQEDAGFRGHNWPEYKESLAKRGEMYLTFDFLQNWDKDLEQLNRASLAESMHILGHLSSF
jgi:hypothetical protein